MSKTYSIQKGSLLCALIIITTLLPITAQADSAHHHNVAPALEHAPIGVMGDHRHKKGEFMFSYRFMQMNMAGNRSGTNNLSNEEIVTNVDNRFFGTPGQPATVRVVPTKMTTKMHMFGTMMAPSDDLTLMAMLPYIDRDMQHLTYQGGAGTTELGTFTTNSRGWGDVKLSGLYNLYEANNHRLHANIGVSIPTGSIKKTANVLTPMNTRPQLRMPYAMQLGSGTYDLLPGVTYAYTGLRYGFGGQYNATIRTGRNNQGYSWGNKHEMTAWASYALTPDFSVSGRVKAQHEGKIDGIDTNIVAPIQTANPDNYGGDFIMGSVGIDYIVPNGALKGHRFSTELTIPAYQNMNGVQMKRQSAVMVGWSKSF